MAPHKGSKSTPETSLDPSPFILPSVKVPLTGSYTYASPIPKQILENNEPCCLGVDEAGRGPCLGNLSNPITNSQELTLRNAQGPWCMQYVTTQNRAMRISKHWVSTVQHKKK